MKTSIAVLTALALLAFGCENQPDDPEPTEQPAEDEGVDTGETTIDDEAQKVNDQNDLEDTDNGDCPPPSQSDQMCAQVITWALSPEGQCCQYPTPCNTPENWETFQNEEACKEAAE